jgi:tryptophan-rich sensory protein
MLYLWQIGNVAAYCVNAFTTYALGSSDAIGKKFGAKSNKQISELYPTLITPAGWAFSIWGPIFLLEGASVIWMCIQTDHDEVLAAASPYWIMGCVLQAGWTVAFCFEKIPLSSVIITGAL